MSARSHFAAPLLLIVVVALILYVSLYPFRFAADGPSIAAAFDALTWARAGRREMFNNLLLYLPLGFCLALLVEPRFGRVAAFIAGTAAGAFMSLAMEITQASIPMRVPSYTDLALNTTGALAGAMIGSAWHVLGSRMTPRGNPLTRSRAVPITIVVLWLATRLWPLLPDASLSQLKAAVRPLFRPEFAWSEFVAFFVGWLIVAQAVFHLARRQRGVDAFLIVIATVLVGRTITAGNVLVPAELAAIVALLPALVLLNRLEDKARSAIAAAALGVWLAVLAVPQFVSGAAGVSVDVPTLEEFFLREPPPPVQLAGKGFSYVAFGWLLTGAGLFPHVAAGVTVVFVLLLCMLQAGAARPVYGWIDLVIAIVAAVMVARWTPRSAVAAARGC
jgi:glycopeptide antibiotics resistance protein